MVLKTVSWKGTVCEIGVDHHKVKESGQRARPETEQLKPAAIVKLENDHASIVGITIHRPHRKFAI